MRNIYIVLFSFFLFATLTALFAPSVVSWYFDPPTAIGVSCKEAVVWGITAYQKMVLLGGVAGLLIGIIMAFVLRRKKTVPVAKV
jgi:hypothetical protein